MARRKLNPFTADEAGDAFVPTVKTIKGANVSSNDKTEKKSEQDTKQDAPVQPAKEDAKQPDSSKPEVVNQSVDKTVGQVRKATGQTEVQKSQPKKTVEPTQKNLEMQKSKPVKPVLASDRLPAESEASVAEKKKGSTRDQIVEMVGFQLGDSEFGIDIKQVQDINRMIEITTVPKAPHFVRGVMNLRGKVIPVLSMRSRFGLEDQDADKKSRIIVVELKGTVIGFIVDAVSEVLRVNSSTIENTTDLVNWIDAEYIKGVAKHQGRLLVLIDLEKVLFGKSS